MRSIFISIFTKSKASLILCFTTFLLFTFTFLLYATDVSAQSIKGAWKGELNLSGMTLPLIFHIDSTQQGYISTMDSPSQGAKGISTNTTVFSNNELMIQIDKIQFIYKGKLVSNDALNGELTQFGKTFAMNLQRQLVQDSVKLKPQEPTQPYPFVSEEVSFVNPIGGHSLAGTLTLPKSEGRFPCAILISGSGPQNRDEELMGHKPFLVLSDYLTRQGIAVLRFDDRGVGKSGGEFATATTGEFATDVEAAIAYLRTRTDIISIGLIGHSEGGIIAPMVASRNKETVAVVVLMAGTGIRGKELLLLQSQLISKVNGVSAPQIKKNTSLNDKLYELVMTSKDDAHIKKEATKLMAEYSATRVTEADIEGLLAQINSPWFRYFLSLDPSVFLEKTTCHVLALNGTLDLQVPAKENLTHIEKSLKVAGNKNYRIVYLKGLNHLFQKAKTGNPSEYATIEETINPKALKEIREWILEIYR
jgi:alpha/beta superfamily hydrolase